MARDDLARAFAAGDTFRYESIAGHTAGTFAGWTPENPWYVGVATSIGFEGPLGRWLGKEFSKPFGSEIGSSRGSGINLFANRFRPKRYRFDTYAKLGRDGKPCIALDYTPYIGPMMGLTDDLREIERGVFLGEMNYRFPWRKKPMLIGYFCLCALE
jgi:hypothetical protein